MDYPFESLGPVLHGLALVLLVALAAAAVGVAYVLAVLPGRVARARNHPQADAVNVCGWLGLLTGLGWIVAVVWAYWQPAGSAQDAEALQELAEQIDRLEATVADAERAAGGKP